MDAKVKEILEQAAELKKKREEAMAAMRAKLSLAK